MFKIIYVLFEIIGGVIATWKCSKKAEANETEIVKKIKNATEIRNNFNADEQLLLPKNQRDA